MTFTDCLAQAPSVKNAQTQAELTLRVAHFNSRYVARPKVHSVRVETELPDDDEYGCGCTFTTPP